MRGWIIGVVGALVCMSHAQAVQVFTPGADGSQRFTGQIDGASALDVRLSGMQSGHTLQIEAEGDAALDLALMIDSAFETQIVNDGGAAAPERASYTFPADGDYMLSLFTLAGSGTYSLRLTVPELATTPDPSMDPPAENPLRPLESTEQQLVQFQAASLAAVQTQQGTFGAPLEEVRVPLQGLRIGDTVYAVVSGPDIAPLLTLYDSGLTIRHAQDQNAGAANSAFIVFQVERAGDYVLSFFSITSGGDYVLRYGVNTPELQADMNAPAVSRSGGSRSFFVSRGTNAQRFTGTMTTADTITVRVQGARTGDIVYAAATGRGNFDPVLTLRDRDGNAILRDDNGGGGTVALIQFTSSGQDQLLLELTANVGGEYILHVGVNTPSVLDAVGMGSTVNLFDYSEFVMAGGTTREFGGRLNTSYDRVTITITGVRAGDTIYAFAEGVGGLDPYLLLYSPNFQYLLAEDDDSGGGLSAALAQRVDQFGEYTLVLRSLNGAGGYRVVVGTNNPAILSDNAAQAVEAARAAGFDCSRADPNSRPVLSGPVERIESPNAIVHYTLSGVDATTHAYARALSEAVEKSLDVQFNQLGWRRPPPDCGLSGDDRLDVYVMDIAYGAIGYASPENMVGDNPNTPEVELYSAFSYLVIENDMDFLQTLAARDYNIDPLDLMRVTAAHEVHHAIQFGYDTNETFFGFYESGAMWIETLVYPELTDAYEYTALFRHPDLCLGSRTERLRVYAEWVLIDSFTRDIGPTSYQQLWEYLSTRDNLTGFYEGLALLGTTVEDVIGRMAIRNLLLDYPNGDRFAVPVTISDAVRGPGTINSGERGTQQQAVDYLRVVPGVWRFEVRSGNGIVLRLVGVRGQTATSYTLGRGGTVDTRPYDAAFLIVQNTLRHRQIEDCYFTIWTLDVREGNEAALTPPDPDMWSAVHYRDVMPVGGR